MRRPQSATHGVVAAIGFAVFILSVVVVRLIRPFGNDVLQSAVLIIVATTVAIFLVDLVWQKVHLRPSTGLDFARDDPSWRRTMTKMAGLLGSLGFVALCYWLFPEYNDKFFQNYYQLLRLILLPWIALAIPYFYWVDRKMRQPCDGYWHMGKLVMLQWSAVDANAVRQHLLGWMIKGFFMALMFSIMCVELRALFLVNFGAFTGFRHHFDFLYHFLLFIDVGIAAMGYAMSFRITDTHIRSSEPTMLGWLVALACYEPFWSLIGRHYLAYDTGPAWDAWLANKPVLYSVWGGGILILTAIYVGSTVIFGARFSNLTHRGIITNGPYRWTKHPAYVAKNLTWWMMAVPFMPNGPPEETLRRCLLLIALNLIYVMRAKTEEWHLSRDPTYVEYALWIEQNGLFRSIRKLPLLRYFAFRIPARSIASP